MTALPHVLIVDDDADIRNVLEILLKNKYFVEEASDGASAIDYVSAHPEVDLIILDVMMPGLSGFETCSRLRELSHAPILFLTAKSAGGDHPCTGELVQVDGGLLEDFLSKGYTPVVATIAQGAEDPTQVYSVSANHTAAKLAVALGAEKLVLLTDVRGLMMDPQNENTLLPVVRLSQVPGLVQDGVIKGGMIPKVECCVEAVRSGVENAIILDGRIPHSILIELLSDEGVGTMLL